MRQNRHLQRANWMGLTAGLALLVTTGCGLLDASLTGGGGLVRSGEGGAPYLVVTITGSPAARSTLTVAETIPDSTPLPRPVLPTPDPAATPRSAASPSIAQQRAVSAAARASRPGDSLVPLGSPVAASP
jgi:hypothetical protein